ncbi:uncharacterized protein LOC141913991 [Tubulanus polymorphus]|uniref:uncharacterized protein LOC141913991 n=1 Tax=Tubulanus polymorphus TaxID=672921 RepID=UPI003DA2D47A
MSGEVLLLQEDEFPYPATGCKRPGHVVCVEVGELASSVAYVTASENEINGDVLKINLAKISAANLVPGLEEVKDRICAVKDTDVTVVCSGCLRKDTLEKIKNVFNTDELVRLKKSECLGKSVHHMLAKMDEADSMRPYTDPDIAALLKRAFGYAPPKDPSAQPDPLFPALVCSMGDSFEIYKVKEDGSCKFLEKVLGYGGVYLASLGRALTGYKTIDEIIAASKDGDPANISTTLTEAIPESYGDVDTRAISIFYPFVVEVFPMGKLIQNDITEPNPDDLMAALANESYRTMMTMMNHHTKRFNLTKTYFTGMLFPGNERLVDYIHRMPYSCVFTQQRPNNVRLLKYENYLPVIGGVLKTLG